MGLFMHDWLLQLYYEVSTFGAAVTKHYLSIDNDEKTTTFSYYEKGSKIPGQSSMILVHGFSSNKEAWLPLMSNIPDGYHCIAIDLPGHGETIAPEEDDLAIDKVIDKLKLFFDKMNLIDPLYIVGASIGGTVVAMFVNKYPTYVSMICLLSPPPTKEYESELISQVRSGMDHVLLPETPEQFYAMADVLTVKRVNIPQSFVHRYFKSRLRLLDAQKKLLKSFLDCEYHDLEKNYEELKNLKCPALILWGRQDQLCTVEGAEYFSKLIPDSEVRLFDDCGHFISYDKPKETADNITNFLDLHSYCMVELQDEI